VCERLRLAVGERARYRAVAADGHLVLEHQLRRVLPADEVEPAAAGLASQTELSLRVNRCAVTADRLEAALREAGFDPVRGAYLPDDVLKVRTATPAALPGYAEGWFAVQDEASVLVAAAVQAPASAQYISGQISPIRSRYRWLRKDSCSMTALTSAVSRTCLHSSVVYRVLTPTKIARILATAKYAMMNCGELSR